MSESNFQPADAGAPPADAGVNTLGVQSSQNADAGGKIDVSDDLQKAIEARQKAKDSLREERRARQELEARLAKIEEEKAKEQGHYKELWEKTSQDLREVAEAYSKEKIARALAARAEEHGLAISVENALKLGNTDLLEFDSKTGNLDGIDAFYEDLKRTEPASCAPRRTTTVNPTVPGGAKVPREPSRTLDDLSVDEIKQQIISLEKRGA